LITAQGQRAGVAAVLAVLLTLCAEPALADETAAPAPANQQKALAQARYEQGVQAFRNERYVDAVRLFLDADAIAPSAALSFNVALAYEKLGDEAAALRWYRNYLRLDPDARNAAGVRARIQSLSQALASKGIQQLTVLSSPRGATVAIDGRAAGVTPLTVELAPGNHVAWLTAPGHSDARREFQLATTIPMDLVFTLPPREPHAPAAPVTSSGDAPSTGTHRRFGIWPYVTIGAGAAALTGAVIFEVLRASAEADARHQEEQLAFEHDVDRMNSDQTTARVLLGIGGVLAVTGTTLAFFNTPLVADTRAAVAPLRDGAAVSFSRTF
jgi:tetratricopeptide (TPR) repeat protein